MCILLHEGGWVDSRSRKRNLQRSLIGGFRLGVQSCVAEQGSALMKLHKC